MQIPAPVLKLYNRICATKYGLLFFVIASSCILNGFFYGMMDATSVVTDVMGTDGGFDYGLFSISTTMLLLFSGFFAVFFSYLTLKWSYYRVLRLGLVLEILGILGFGFIAGAPSLVPMLIFSVVWGAAGGALSYGIVFGAAQNRINHRYVPLLSAAIFTSHSAVSMLLTPFLNTALDKLGIALSFIILAAIALCTLPVIEVLKDREIEAKEEMNITRRIKQEIAEVRRFMRIIKSILMDGFFWIAILIFFSIGFMLSQAINDAETAYYLAGAGYMIPVLICLLNIILIAGSIILTKRLKTIDNKYQFLAIGFLCLAPLSIFSPVVPYEIILPVEILFAAGLMFLAFPLCITMLSEKYPQGKIQVVFSLILISYYLGQNADSILDGFGTFFIGGYDLHIFIGTGLIVLCSHVLFVYNKWLGAEENKGFE